MARRRAWMVKGVAATAMAVGLVVGSGVAAASAHTGRQSIGYHATQYQCQQQLSQSASYWRGTGHELRFDDPCHNTSRGWTASFVYYHPGGPV